MPAGALRNDGFRSKGKRRRPRNKASRARLAVVPDQAEVAVTNDTAEQNYQLEEQQEGLRLDYRDTGDSTAPQESDQSEQPEAGTSDEFRLDYESSGPSSSPSSEPGEDNVSVAELTELLQEYLIHKTEEEEAESAEVEEEPEDRMGELKPIELDIRSEDDPLTDGSELGIVNKNYHTTYKPDEIGLQNVGSPEELMRKLAMVGYQCNPFIASQISLLLTAPTPNVRSVMLEGPSGCGKSFLAKSLAKITGAEFLTLTCYQGMNLQDLIEKPSTLALVNAMAGKENLDTNDVMNLGIISRAFVASQTKPVILLVDELDKVEVAIDTFFLGPLQDARIWLESRPPIDANVNNLLIVFTKNFERPLNDALLRRVQPIRMDYIDSTLERKVLEPHCVPQLVTNLVTVADIMRYSDGSYPFERPPAPEELLKSGKYVAQLLEWNVTDFSFIGKNLWYMMAKSEHDRTVFEQMLRYHPDFFDPLHPDGRTATMDEVFARLGRLILKDIVADPDAEKRGEAYRPEAIGLTKVGSPQELARKLGEVGYECLPFVATQISLLLNTPTDRTRGLLLEGPSGCGKSFMGKCLAKITGADFMCLSCYKDMNTAHLIEVPSALAVAKSMSSGETAKEKLMNLGILSRAFLKSQSQPVILLIDELDKVGPEIDTFFLGPIQDGRIFLESRPRIDANLDNLLIIFTKNYNRVIDQALLRRLHPIRMTYLDSTLERNILSKHCVPQLVANLVSVAERMRESNGSYAFERPPAPEELLTSGHYIAKLLEWGVHDFAYVGKNVWAILSKSDHDRAVLEHMLRYHPDFQDPLFPDGKNTPVEEIHARLGRWILKGIVEDRDAERRERAWEDLEYN